MILRVDAGAGTLQASTGSMRCSLGRTGTIAAPLKREGDGATPLGRWPVRGALLRPDRVPPVSIALPWRWLRPDDGWSDDPRDPAYNRPVHHPHAFSAERLWREDGLYDIVVVLGHNDAPPVPSLGSAIFLHCWIDGRSTEGCVAVELAGLLALLPGLRPGDVVAIAAR